MRAIHLLPLVALLLAPVASGADDAEAKERKEAAQLIAKKLASKNDEEVYGGVQEAALNQDPSLTAPLTKLLKDKNAVLRYAAIEALATRTLAAEQKQAARALATRLKPLADDEDDREELMKVIQALHDLAQESTIKALLDSKNEEDRDVRQARAMAVANVPSKEAIERLIQYGYKDRRGAGRTRDIAVKALRYATGEQIKGGGIEEWRKWWSENEKTFDAVAAADKRKEQRSAQAAKAAKKEERKNKKRAPKPE